MAQHDYVIDNSTGANVRADINNVLLAISSNNSGSSAPSTTFATQFFADTNAGIMKLRNTSNNGYVNLFTLAGGIDVDAASNFNGDVTFTGASANIVFNKSDNALEFADNAKAEFGTSADLQVFHDSSHSRIHNNTGILLIEGDGNIEINAGASTANMARFINGGAVELYHDNSKKFFTISNGVQATNRIIVGEGSAQRGLISGDANSVSVGSISDIPLNFTRNSLLKARIDGNDFQIPNDNGKIELGASQDLQIYHDGTHSRIHNSTGSLFVRANNGFGVFNGDGSETLFNADTNGAVELYFNNNKRFETTSNAVDVSGGVIVHASTGINPSVDIEQQVDANFTAVNIRNFYSSSGRNMIVFLDNNGNVVGSIVNDGSGITYNTTSDYRLKENVVPISDGLTRLNKLKPYRFNFIDYKDITQDGFLAHEVQEIMPEAVKNEKDGEEMQEMDYTKLITLLVASVQELSAKVAALEAA